MVGPLFVKFFAKVNSELPPLWCSLPCYFCFKLIFKLFTKAFCLRLLLIFRCFGPIMVIKFGVEITCTAAFTAFVRIITFGPSIASAVAIKTSAFAFEGIASFVAEVSAVAIIVTFRQSSALCLAFASSLGSLATVVLALYLVVSEGIASAEELVMQMMIVASTLPSMAFIG